MNTQLTDLLAVLPFRQIGPSRGGRVVTVAGDPSDPAVYYFGAVAGGVFKSVDAGITWLNVSDGFFNTSSVGAIAVSESHPNVIYAGTGEATIRTDVSYGDGVYKSTDAGTTWKHTGLSDTRHIGKIVIHPTNPDLVYVAALGHAFGETEATNDERGVFRSKDGGATWQRVLFKSRRAGAVDITLDAHNPDVLYAAIWQAHRNFWELSSGGPDSGLWRSRDGGATWADISANKGLEGLGLIGKIGVSASPVQAGRVYALIEAKDKPGLYRSDDFGETWQLASDNGDLRRRPFYYMHVHADTQEADTVYVNNLGFHKSTDAGKTWTAIQTPHGDNHGLWIDPKNNRRLIQGNDGGANISFNGGGTFGSIYNQLTGQFYHLAVDNQFPYRIYGTQQDNSSISVPSDTINGAITWADCYVAGTGESGYIAVKPDDPNIVIVGAVGSSVGGQGALQKYDHRTGQIQLINIWPVPFANVAPATFKHRFPWTYPISFSPHNPNTLYVAGDKVWKSKDLGHSWDVLSPDLTRNDQTKLQISGGPITPDTSGAEFYATISTFRESLIEKNVFVAGSDDGLVHISRDGGDTWKDITPNDLPEWTLVRTVEPSAHEAGTWYLAATRYKLDDFRPYVFVTRNYGKTWTKITNGIPDDEFVRVIRADPKRKGLLYAGTELGLYVSLNDGENWQKWSFDPRSGGNLPITPVYDLLVKDDDLIVGTHGRGLWALDDLSALRELVRAASRNKSATNADEPHLFTPGVAHRVLLNFAAAWNANEGKSYTLGLGSSSSINTAKTDETGQVKRKFHDAGEGRDRGAILYYILPESIVESLSKSSVASASKNGKHNSNGNVRPGGPVIRLEFLDNKGSVIRAYEPKPADYDAWDDKCKSLNIGPWLPVKAGMNRFLWNLRHAGATRVAGNKTAVEANEGPMAVPGSYAARLTVGEHVRIVPVEIVKDARVSTSQADLEKQERLLLRLRDKISEAHAGVNKIRSLREQLGVWQKRTGDLPEIGESITPILEKLDAIEDRLILPGDQKDDYGLIAHKRMNATLSELISVVGIADFKPTKVTHALFTEHATAVDAELAMLADVQKTDIAALNRLIAERNVPAVA